MRAISWKGVILGGIADIVATNLAAFPVAIVAAMSSNLTGLPASERAKALVGIMQGSPAFEITGWALGAMCSVLGGYVAARVAKRGELINGALSAYLCIGLGIYSMMAGHSVMPLWQHLAAFVISPILGAYGGYLWLRRANRVLVAKKVVQPA